MITDIYDLLYRLDLTATHESFFHVSYAVLLSTENRARLLLVAKWLYPAVAKHYRTTPERVEHNIYIVATMVWSNNPKLLRALSRYQLPGQPTASQFISILASSLFQTNFSA